MCLLVRQGRGKDPSRKQGLNNVRGWMAYPRGRRSTRGGGEGPELLDFGEARKFSLSASFFNTLGSCEAQTATLAKYIRR